MPTLQSNGITIAYETQGDASGEPVLLIAGLGLQLISWPEPFCRTLVEQGYRLIRFDNRDSGLSSKMDEYGKPDLAGAFFRSMFHMPVSSGYTLHDMAQDAIGVLDALGIARAHVVGASMGGMIAQIMAASHAGRVSSLTSIMSTSGRPGLPGPTMAANQAMFSRPANPRDLDSVVDHFVRLFKVIGSPKYPTPDEELRRMVEASVRRNPSWRGTARQIMAVAGSGDRVALLRTVEAPTLVVHGSADPLVPIAGGRDTAFLVPGAVLHEIEGMGHDLPPGLSEQIAALIAAHCAAASAPAAHRA
ncbi:alpha/beta fold hydrolase [Noviherbaspirillum galbum]|uniref:Alpha/beta hydrolase n=1 Tax=Noviherbaspirillum galbum TaxID=2709383 RepID=A0A6B3SGJ0_9BURK|nr:alpha/beta fold hydrolase [Noviherbaspirillum galbum]NEX59740.1 alpha/beta hydrolase [Noviherbaspirillum galbum]